MAVTNKKETVAKFVQLADQVESVSLAGATIEEKKASLLDFIKVSNEKFDQFKNNHTLSKV
ncbi:MAG: hypothetical protein ACI8WB_002097 [Phenylobacterium sp.]|jgi:hypothetical protein